MENGSFTNKCVTFLKIKWPVIAFGGNIQQICVCMCTFIYETPDFARDGVHIFRCWRGTRRAGHRRVFEIHDLDRTVASRTRAGCTRRFPEMTIQHVGTRRDVVSRIFLVGDLA